MLNSFISVPTVLYLPGVTCIYCMHFHGTNTQIHKPVPALVSAVSQCTPKGNLLKEKHDFPVFSFSQATLVLQDWNIGMQWPLQFHVKAAHGTSETNIKTL